MALRIVDYDPNDYKLAAVLTSGAGEVLEGDQKIGPVFSLFFQWAEKNQAFLRYSKSTSELVSCKITRDIEERDLSQLYVSIPLNSIKEKVVAENLFIRMVIFEVCYEFESSIIDHWIEGEEQNFIIDVPKNIKMILARKAPRSSKSDVAVDAKWIVGNEIINCFITSMGLDSCVIDCQLSPSLKGILQIAGHDFIAKVVRNWEGEKKSVIKIDFSSDYETGLYFDVYKMFRYPRLSSRTRYEVEDVLELYKRAGFFNNFSSKFDEEDKLEKIKTDWNNIKSAEHHHTADYCLEQSGKLAGTSSLAQFCQTPNLEYWVFHQLCADKELTTLEDTGTLYNWRCEYLHLRKKDSASYVWFRSESRWLERIYVKFNTQNPQLGELKTCSLFTYIHHASEGDSLNVRVYNFGDGKRAIYKDDYITAGAGPNYVHINRNMNVIICNDGDWTKVKNAANKICQALNEKSLYFRVEIDNSNPDSSIEIEPQNGTDRVTIIKKVGLLDLIPCVNHSIAVTKLKKGIK